MTFTHAAGCTTPDQTLTPFTGSQGDRMVRCPRCRRFAILAPADTATTSPTPTATPLVDATLPILTGWVCRDHHKPVTQRGAGCPKCTDEREHAHNRGRAQLRIARRQAQRSS